MGLVLLAFAKFFASAWSQSIAVVLPMECPVGIAQSVSVYNDRWFNGHSGC